MHPRLPLLILSAVLSTARADTPPEPPPVTVDVEFVNPDGYSDINNQDSFAYVQPGDVLAELDQDLVTLGRACLPPGSVLGLRILDVHLAGTQASHLGHFRNPDVRIMRDSSWPSMRIAWELQDAEGHALGQAQETVSDMSYLTHAFSARQYRYQLPYEHAMLARWFAQRICPLAGPVGAHS